MREKRRRREMNYEIKDRRKRGAKRGEYPNPLKFIFGGMVLYPKTHVHAEYARYWQGPNRPVL
jgi:hypothetical protein